jgi:integrase-like protein
MDACLDRHRAAHTLATRMINRGMSLEAIAALLGHRSMRMALTYAASRTRTVAEEYFRVTQAVEESYESGEPLPASVEGTNVRRIAAEHRRLLGNGHCTRPTGLDCTFESVCERCGLSVLPWPQPRSNGSPMSSHHGDTSIRYPRHYRMGRRRP